MNNTRTAAVPVPEIERALALSAYIVARHGAVYAPIFEFLEAELLKARHKADPIARARRHLALHAIEAPTLKAIRNLPLT